MSKLQIIFFPRSIDSNQGRLIPVALVCPSQTLHLNFVSSSIHTPIPPSSSVCSHLSVSLPLCLRSRTVSALFPRLSYLFRRVVSLSFLSAFCRPPSPPQSVVMLINSCLMGFKHSGTVGDEKRGLLGPRPPP